MPVLVPDAVELKYLDSAGNLQTLPAMLLEGQEAPKHHAILVYKKADGSLGLSTLDVILAAIRDRLPSGGSATEATLSAMKTAVDALNSAVSTAERQDAAKAVLDAIKTGLDTVHADLDTVEQKLGDITSPATGSVNGRLATLNAKDFATQSTLVALKAAFDTRDLASGAKQDAAKSTLDSIDARLQTLVGQTDSLEPSLASVDGKLPAQLAGRVPVLSGWPAATDRWKYDMPAAFESGTLYMGIAARTATTAQSAWTVRRVVFDANGNPADDQVLTDIAWDSRVSAGWV